MPFNQERLGHLPRGNRTIQPVPPHQQHSLLFRPGEGGDGGVSVTMPQRYHIPLNPPSHRGNHRNPPLSQYTFFISYVRDTPTAFSKERRRNEQKKENFAKKNI